MRENMRNRIQQSLIFIDIDDDDTKDLVKSYTQNIALGKVKKNRYYLRSTTMGK